MRSVQYLADLQAQARRMRRERGDGEATPEPASDDDGDAIEVTRAAREDDSDKVPALEEGVVPDRSAGPKEAITGPKAADITLFSDADAEEIVIRPAAAPAAAHKVF